MSEFEKVLYDHAIGMEEIASQYDTTLQTFTSDQYVQEVIAAHQATLTEAMAAYQKELLTDYKDDIREAVREALERVKAAVRHEWQDAVAIPVCGQIDAELKRLEQE